MSSINRSTQAYHTTYGAAELNRRVEEGLKRAPLERARAIRELWGWIRSV